MGARLCRLRGRREAKLATRAWSADVPRCRLGRTGRIRRPRARKLGAALSRHLGHRARDRGDLRAEAARRGERPVRAPPPCRRTDRRGRRGGRGAWRSAGTLDGATRCGVVAKHSGRVRVPLFGRHRGQRWHRREPRPGAEKLAEADGPGARTVDQRRSRACRRPDDRHHRIRWRARDQQRPDVALHRGHHQLRPDLAAARHPDPAGSVVAVAGRARQAAAVAAIPGVRHARHAGVHRANRPGLHLVRTECPHHRQGVRTVRARSRTPT